MSQSGIYLSSIIPPAGPVETLTGNTGGAVPPTAGNINVVGDNTTISIAGNPGTSTLVVSAVGTTFYTATTVGATPVTVVAVPVPNNSAVGVFCKTIGARSDFSLSIGLETVASAQTALGITTLAGVPGGIVSTIATTSTMQFSVSGNTLLVQVVGEAGETWNWSVYVQVINQT